MVRDITPPGVENPRDFVVPRSAGFWPFMGIYLLVTLTIYVPIVAYYRPSPRVSQTFPVLLAFACLWIWSFIQSRKVRRRIAAVLPAVLPAAPANPADAADPADYSFRIVACLDGLPHVGVSSTMVVAPRAFPASRAARALAAAGATGRILRLASDPDRLTPLAAPFDVPFEPLLLAARSPAFQAFTGGAFKMTTQFRENIRRSMEIFGKSRFMRGFMILSIGIGFISLPFMVYLTIREILMGQVPSFLLGIFAVVPFLLALILVRISRQEEWLLVPGALVIRSASMFSKNWRITRATRADSVLVYWSDYLFLALASRDGAVFGRIALPVEAEAAMRAWLSPLAPPPPEQLSDLV